MKKYYIYKHKTETDGRCFYVGYGSEKRPYDKSNRSKEWKEIYEKEGLIVEIHFVTTYEEEALKVESEYIQKYGRICDGGSLINKATYKSNGGVKCSEETKQKMSKALSGEKHYLFGKPSHKRKSILQYTKDGEFIKEWSSVIIAAKELNLHQSNISNVCKGKLKTTGGYIWRYKKGRRKI